MRESDDGPWVRLSDHAAALAAKEAELAKYQHAERVLAEHGIVLWQKANAPDQFDGFGCTNFKPLVKAQAVVARLVKMIQRGTAGEKDWACAECRPESDCLVDGFQCHYHEALALISGAPPEADRDRLAAENAGLREEVAEVRERHQSELVAHAETAGELYAADMKIAALTASEKVAREALAVVVGALHRLDAIYAAEQEPRDDGSLPRPSWLASVLAQHPSPQPETKGGDT